LRFVFGPAGFPKAIKRVRQLAVTIVDEGAGHGLQAKLLCERPLPVVDDLEVDRDVAQEALGIGALGIDVSRR
jgi:hypothetical protein